MLRRLYELARYNRDWPAYLFGRLQRAGKDDLSTFRLRNGQVITLKSEARFTLNEIYLDHVYDVPGVDLARCASVLDIGANVGLFALYVASQSPRVNLHCFEPEPRNFELLERNLQANRVRAQAYQRAVSTSVGAGHLHVGAKSIEYSLGEAGANTTQVECVDWDSVFKLAGVERFDFMKMDIEGHEREILANCRDEQLRRLGAFSLEWHHDLEELRALARRLQRIGFDANPTVRDGHVLYLKARARPA